MNTRFCILSSLLFPALIGASLLSGCGGSSQDNEMYLPVGLQRNVMITLPDDNVYVFGFEVTSTTNATVYDGKSAAPSTASLHVRNYVPASDTADQIAFYWSTNRDGEATPFNCYVIMRNVTNVGTGTGRAVCDVSDVYFADPAVVDCEGTIIAFNSTRK